MTHEVTIKILVESTRDEERVAKLIESVFEFGTIREAIADGLKLDDDPHLKSVEVKQLQDRSPTTR